MGCDRDSPWQHGLCGSGGEGRQQAQLLLGMLGFSVRRVAFVVLETRVGSESSDSDILSQMMSTKRSNTALTLMFSLAEVSKNSNPAQWAAQHYNNSTLGF